MLMLLWTLYAMSFVGLLLWLFYKSLPGREKTLMCGIVLVLIGEVVLFALAVSQVQRIAIVVHAVLLVAGVFLARWHLTRRVWVMSRPGVQMDIGRYRRCADRARRPAKPCIRVPRTPPQANESP